MKPTTVTPETMHADGQALSRSPRTWRPGLTELAEHHPGRRQPVGRRRAGHASSRRSTNWCSGKAFESIVSHVQQVGYAGQALGAQASAYDQVETGNSQAASAPMRIG